jgi:hypothetical protein
MFSKAPGNKYLDSRESWNKNQETTLLLNWRRHTAGGKWIFVELLLSLLKFLL